MIDSHAHLDMPEFAVDLPAILERAEENGVSRIRSIGIDTASSLKATRLAKTRSAIYTSVGIHPSNANHFNEEELNKIAKLAYHSEVVGVGEIGLDYYRDYASRDKQKDAFTHQLELAATLGLPAIIHCRQAEEELLPMLEGFGNGVIHCFSSNIKIAQ
jgi:TatD DNase family protein